MRDGCVLTTLGTALKHHRPKPTLGPGVGEDLTDLNDDDDEGGAIAEDADAYADVYPCGYAGCVFAAGGLHAFHFQLNLSYFVLEYHLKPLKMCSS